MRHIVMQYAVLQGVHFTRYHQVRMYFSFVPPTLIPPEQTGLIIRKITSIAKPTSEHVILAGNAKQMDIGRVGCDRIFYFLFKAMAQCLVPVDLKYSFVFAPSYGQV